MRDAIMSECLDREHWEFWALRIPTTTLLIEGIFECPLLTSACSVIVSGQKIYVYMTVYIQFVGQSKTFEENAQVFFFSCSFCRSGSDI